jgi:aspartate aminotransferase
MKTWPVMSPFPVSENVARMQSSATMAAMQAAEALRASGADVCDFGAGEPDFDTPDNIKEAAAKAMWAGRTKYTANAGIRELQSAIIDFYRKKFGTEYQPSEVIATAGGKQAIFNAVVTLLNPGDEALIPKPYWVTFPEIAVFAGAKPVFIETDETDFVLSAKQVERAITPRTKLLILNSPSNPSASAGSTSFPMSVTCALSTRRARCLVRLVCLLNFDRVCALPDRFRRLTP